MGVQIIRAPNGDEMVVMSRAEYEALLAGQRADDDAEDAADVAMYDARKADLARSSAAAFPPEASEHLLRGDTRLKALRKWRGLSQAELADRAGIGQGYVSEIESGRKIGRTETLAAVAAVLDVPLEWIA